MVRWHKLCGGHVVFGPLAEQEQECGCGGGHICKESDAHWCANTFPREEYAMGDAANHGVVNSSDCVYVQAVAGKRCIELSHQDESGEVGGGGAGHVERCGAANGATGVSGGELKAVLNGSDASEGVVGQGSTARQGCVDDRVGGRAGHWRKCGKECEVIFHSRGLPRGTITAYTVCTQSK